MTYKDRVVKKSKTYWQINDLKIAIKHLEKEVDEIKTTLGLKTI